MSVEGRYAEEKVEQSSIARNAGGPAVAPVNVAATFKKFSPRILLDWKVSADNLLYASFAQGQKPGGFNGVTAIQAGVPSYQEEEVDAFEIGSKNVFLDGALTANLAVFYNEIQGYQLTQNVQSATQAVSAVVNAGDARVFGLELELVARPSDNLTFTANYALADSKFTAGFDENQGVLNDVLDDRLVNCSTGDQFPNVAGCQSLFGSIVGKSIPRAPVHQVFADIDYRMPLGDGGWKFFTGANVSLVSSSFAQVHNLAETGGSAVADFRIGIENENFKIQGYVKNLFDEDSVAQIIRYADGNDTFKRNFIASLRPGRRFGVVLSARY
ncbi:TonB-dependent receptor [Parasphingorhabdus halotolerans]|uniref:TonB-dependent receptor n=1 Tax=Parasphingorhabdus halotolerans TaxID=2725558 RepID=UPI001FEBA0BC|nr:TonB-dependent receptor [Parasphingorhabdus halotolerans]